MTEVTKLIAENCALKKSIRARNTSTRMIKHIFNKTKVSLTYLENEGTKTVDCKHQSQITNRDHVQN